MIQRIILSLWKWFLSSLNYTVFFLEENDLHQPFKLMGPSMEPNPRRFGPPTDTPTNNRYNKSKAWATTPSKTYPSWQKDDELTTTF
jgi:hypothetical protein